MSRRPVTPKSTKDPWIWLLGDAVLRLNKNQRVPAEFRMKSFEGMLPGHVELTTADPEAADLAWHNGPGLVLEICGAKIRAPIIGHPMGSQLILLHAAPFVGSLARAIASFDK